MVERVAAASKRERFAAPPWTCASEEWGRRGGLDRHLSAAK